MLTIYITGIKRGLSTTVALFICIAQMAWRNGDDNRIRQ